MNTQTLEPSSQEQLMFTQPKDTNNKIDPHIKNIVHIATEQITQSLLVSKNNELMKINAMHMLDQSLLKNHLYSTFVLLPKIEQNIMITDTEVEVPHETTLTTTIHKIDTVVHLEIDLVMTKVLLLHKTLDHDMILINVIPGLIALHTDPRTDLLIDTTLDLDTDHAPILERIDFKKNTISYRPPLRPRESRFSRSRSHSNSRNKIIDTTTRPI